eukprot:TRINITY_DN49966_c0_g1_i1.p1 TRINITY_DN49966_c0_g1~~TRINITY_DN49966_c0_g1_i1.p1  ORF type:complete len:1829 (+),score=795.29 TRINITY_DN49966_c0_g1_i1:87-5573(+)
MPTSPSSGVNDTGVVYTHNVFDPARPVPRRTSAGSARVPADGSAEAVAESQRRVADCDRMIGASASHQVYAREYLPRVLGNDASLVELDLHDTMVTDVSAGSLADALRVNTCVTSCNLSDNMLGAEAARSLADALTVNTALTELDLRMNAIDASGGQALAEALRANTTLRRLHLDNNALMTERIQSDCATLVALNSRPPGLKAAVLAARSGGPRLIDLSADTGGRYRDLEHDPAVHLDCWAAGVLADALVGNRKVEELRLVDQHIADEGARHLADMLRRNERLERINLFGNAVSDEGCAAFCAALEQNNICTVVNLKNNACGEEALWQLEKHLTMNRQPLSLKVLLPRIAANDPELVHLKLDEHASCRQYDDVSARLVADALPLNDNLTALDLAHNRIGPVGAHFLADALGENTGLRVLDLSHNPIARAGVGHIAEALLRNRTLSVFRMAHCDIDDAAGTVLAGALQDNVGLTQLDLSDNESVRECGAAFARVIQVNTHLTDLNLSGTGVSAVVLRALRDSRALGQEPPALRAIVPRLFRGDQDLQRVDLRGRKDEYPLSDSSCSVLSPILHDNYVLTDLDLSCNAITTKGVRELCSGLAGNRFTLRRLNLASNAELDYGAARALCGVLRTHQALTALDLSNNRLLDGGGEEFFNFFRREAGSSQLVDLDVRGNRMDPDLERNLMTIVQSHRCLPGVKQRLMRYFDGSLAGDPVLDFSELESFIDPDTPEQLFDEAARVVAHALERCKGHTGLAFRFNRLSDAGAQHLANLLRVNKALVHLDVSHNRLTDEGVAYIVDVLKQRPDVDTVLLEGNKLVTEEMVSKLKHDMHFNKQPDTLKKLLYNVFRNDPSYTVVDCSHLEGQEQMTDSRLTYLCEALVHNSCIKRIDLSHNHITAAGASLLFNTLRVCTQVASLTLRNNVVEGIEVAETLRDLLREPCSKALTMIDLSHNDLDGNAVRAIMESFHENDTLVDLRLAGNRVSDTLLEEVAIAISLNRELEVKRLLPRLAASDDSVSAVDFSGGRAGDVSVYQLCSALRGNTAVERFDLSANREVTDVSAVNYLAPLLRDNFLPLAALSLANTRVTGVGVRALLEALVTNTTLQHLDLRGTDLAPARRVVEAVEETLESNTTLLDIMLTGAGLTEGELATVSAMCLNGQPLLRASLPRLESNDPDLTELSFQGQTSHDYVTCRLLSEPLLHNGVLRRLDLSGSQQIDDAGVAHLSRMLHQNTALTALQLRSCAVGDEGAVGLAAALRVNSVVTELDLGYNAVGTAGARALARTVAAESEGGYDNCTLRLLNLEANSGIDEEAGGELAFQLLLNNGSLAFKHDRSAIRDNQLTELRYPGTPGQPAFTDDSIPLLAAALKGNTSVRDIDLSGNTLEWNGAGVIADLLRTNCTLTRLNLAGNMVGSGATLLRDAMAHNWALTELDLSGTDCAQHDLERTQELVMLNRHPRALKTAIMRKIERDASQLSIKVSARPPPDAPADWEPPQLLDDDGCVVLAEHLKTDIACEAIDLSYNCITCVGACAIADMLRINPAITQLVLSHNRIADTGATALADIMSRHQLLSDVDVSHNCLGDAAPLIAALRSNPLVLRLCVEGNPGCDADALDRVQLFQTLNHKSKAFRELFHKVADCDPGLDEVNMEGWVSLGHYDGQSVHLVAQAVALNPAVRSLNMSFCDVTDKQLAVLAQLIESCPHLQEVNLSNNMITSDISCLTNALCSNRTLTTLCLRDNRIGLEGAKLLAAMLRSNEALRELDLSGNTLGDVGVKILAEGLKMNDTLQNVYVEAQGVSKQAEQVLELALDICYRGVEVDSEADDGPAAELP